MIVPRLGVELSDMEMSPFNQRGGLGKADQRFEDHLTQYLDELNEVLAA